MDELQSILVEIIGECGPPSISKVVHPIVGYHGTSRQNAVSILSKPFGFAVGLGRVGQGVYFFEGGAESEQAIFAAATHAEQKFPNEGPTVLRTEIHVKRVLDLDSEENFEFVHRKMIRRLKEYAYKSRPREVGWIAHQHFVGLLLQRALGSVPKLDRFLSLVRHLERFN